MILVAALRVAEPADPSWLQWQAPPECPDVGAAARATSERLGETPSPEDVQAIGVVEQTEQGHLLRLEVVVAGQRQVFELVSSDCSSLADAAGLVIATSIDPSLGAMDPDPVAIPEPESKSEFASGSEPEPQPQLVPEVELAPMPSASPPPPPPPAEPLEALTLTILGGGDLGTLPRVTGGPRARLELLGRRWRLGVGGSYLAPRVFSNDAGAVRVQAGLADVRACGRLRWSRAELPLCAAVEVGGTHAQGRRDPGRRTARGPRLGAVASAAPRVRLSRRAWAVMTIELAYAPVRTAYVVRDPGPMATVFGPSAVSGRVWLGIEGILRSWR